MVCSADCARFSSTADGCCDTYDAIFVAEHRCGKHQWGILGDAQRISAVSLSCAYRYRSESRHDRNRYLSQREVRNIRTSLRHDAWSYRTDARAIASIHVDR